MIANNLAIAVPCETPCLGKCPYCVSRMTWTPAPDRERFIAKLPKARGLAMASGISSVMITGKGEPLQTGDSAALARQAASAFPDLPVEIQTNGRMLPDNMERAALVGDMIDVFAISIDSGECFLSDRFRRCVSALSKAAVLRATVLASRRLGKFLSPETALGTLREIGFSQVTFAILNFPEGHGNTPQARAVNALAADPVAFGDDLARLLSRGRRIRSGVHGNDIYDVDGISVTDTPKCVQESAGDRIRSLIYQADGRLYTSWNSRGSVVF